MKKKRAERQPIFRYLGAPRRLDGSYVVTGREVLDSLKRMQRFVLFDYCLVWATDLREFARIWREDTLFIHSANIFGKPFFRLETADGKIKARFRDGRIPPSCPVDPTPWEAQVWHQYSSETYRKRGKQLRQPEAPTGVVQLTEMSLCAK